MYDLIILGGGPAGLTAGLYAGRAALNTVIVEKGLPGGQMQNTLEVENYPGFTEIMGPELSEHMHKQALHFGVEWQQGEVTGVSLDGKVKSITVGDSVLEAKAVIIATGAQPKLLGVPGEKEFAGRGVSYCATCDGAFFRGKRVTVIGGGDSAIEEGLFLTRYAEEVNIIHRRDELRAQAVLQKRAFANDKIRFIWNSVVEEIKGSGKVEGVRIFNKQENSTSEMATDGVFIYVGFLPNSAYLEGTGILNEDGYVQTDGNLATSIPGVYSAGDIRDTNLRQIVTAAGDGAVAAMAAFHYLEQQ